MQGDSGPDRRPFRECVKLISSVMSCGTIAFAIGAAPFTLSLVSPPKMIRLRTLPAVATALTIVTAKASAQAGLLSNTAAVSLSATKSPSLTVTVNSGGTQTIGSITDGTTNDFPSSVDITTA